MSAPQELAALLPPSQAHLLRFWGELSGAQRAALEAQVRGLPRDLDGLFQRALAHSPTSPLDGRVKPIPPAQFGAQEASSVEVLENYRNQGLQEIAAGTVGVLLMAGGQGTRLGVAYPKGLYSVGLPSGKTLLHIQAERILRLQALAAEKTGRPGRVPWYIMTSGPTHQTTLEYLKKENYFGINPEDVVLFKQGLLPCFDMQGKVLLEDKFKIALAPDGNGGIYRALAENGVLEDMEKRGIKYIHVHSVDNILVKVADPVFVGYCVVKRADCGAKVVRKAEPQEAVGVVCQVDGQFQVVEYSEISEETANLRAADGKLVYSAGNICNHFFTTRFLREVADEFEEKLKLHVARKKIPYVDESGALVRPTVVQGIKIEKFVFDVFPFSSNFVTWEVPRWSEFSALKNSDEAREDCPRSAREALLALHKGYVERAGGFVEGEVEISPLLSYDGENLEETVQGRTFQGSVVLG